MISTTFFKLMPVIDCLIWGKSSGELPPPNSQRAAWNGKIHILSPELDYPVPSTVHKPFTSHLLFICFPVILLSFIAFPGSIQKTNKQVKKYINWKTKKKCRVPTDSQLSCIDIWTISPRVRLDHKKNKLWFKMEGIE